MTFPATVLGIRVALDLAGDGTYSTNISTSVQQRADITINRGRPDEASVIQPSDCSLTLNNRSTNFSLRNPNGIYYGQIGRNTTLWVSIDAPTSWLVINAETGNTPVAGVSASTPDVAALDIVGDIDLRFDADFDSWSETTELITKWTTAGNQRSYALYLSPTATVRLFWTTDGINLLQATSTVKVPIETGRIALRATLDVDNGAAGKTATFYYSDTINGTWIQLGDVITTAGTTSIFSGSGPLYVLDNPNATDLAGSIIRGKVYAAQVRSSIGGTVVANPDFTAQVEGATSFADSTGKTWTINGAVALTKRDIRILAEVSEWPSQWDTSGVDIYVNLAAGGVMRRLGQGQPVLASAFHRGLNLLTALVAYWPLEEPTGATSFASALSGGVPMTIKGGPPNLSTNTDFASSLPLPEFNAAGFYGLVPYYTPTNDIQVRFLMSIPAAGTVNGKVIARAYTAGTAQRWDLIYSTGGALNLTAYDSDGVSLATTGAVAFAVNGFPCRVSIELDTTGANVGYRVTTLGLHATAGSTVSGTLATATVLRCTKVVMDPDGAMLDVAVGHVTVESAISVFSDVQQQLDAYSGETAGRRIQRLCREEGVAIQGFGDLDASAALGPQLPLTLLDLLKEAAAADLGILGESKAVLGISYRPSSSLVNQNAALTIPYLSVNPLGPIEDDALLRNDLTISRIGGSSYRVTLDTGALSTLAPPLGAGRYDEAYAISVENDADLPDQAGWRVHLGTVNEARYPGIGVNLTHASVLASASVTAALRGLDLGDRVVVSSPPAGRTAPGDVSQLLQGLSEAFNAQAWTMVLKCSPESPWRMGVYGTATIVSRYSSDGSTLNGAHTSGTTSLSVATPSGPLWTHADGDFDIIIAGESMTVTAVAGAASPQTFTVTRSVNGVVKAQSSGASVDLLQPAYYGL